VKVLLAAHGSRGDVQFLLALALALRERQHAVTFAAPENFEAWIRSHGLPFCVSYPDTQRHARAVAAHSTRLSWQVRYLGEELLPKQFACLRRAEPEADLVVGTGLQFAAPSLAEQHGVPYVYAAYTPLCAPSAHLPPPGLPWQRLPRLANRAAWGLLGTIADAALRRALNSERSRMGLEPVARVSDYLWKRTPMLVAADPVLAPRPPDAPAARASTDAWLYEDDEPLPRSVEHFLSTGEAPLFAGFGCMASRDPERLFAVVREAARRAGRRVIIQAGWGGVGERGSAEEDCLVFRDELSHVRLFPRVAAVAHHAGSGTTTTAARAGVPQIPLPHLGDHAYWAERVRALGVGTRALPIHRVTPFHLTRRIRRACDEPAMRERAQWLARQIRGRDGSGHAVEILEEWVGGPLEAPRPACSRDTRANEPRLETA